MTVLLGETNRLSPLELKRRFVGHFDGGGTESRRYVRRGGAHGFLSPPPTGAPSLARRPRFQFTHLTNFEWLPFLFFIFFVKKRTTSSGVDFRKAVRFLILLKIKIIRYLSYWL